MIRTIMVPLDGSAFAERAVPVASQLAQNARARLHLVQVHEFMMANVPDGMVPYDVAWETAARREEREYLRSVANRVAENAGVVARTELLEGVPAMALAQYAREMDIGLIVMTTHGRSGLSRLWLGSVADGLVRRSGVPVLLLRTTEKEAESETPPPLAFQPRHVLIPLDGSELASAVLEPAIWLGSLFNARYTLLRVALPTPLIRAPFPITETDFGDTVGVEQQADLREELELVAGSLRARGLDVRTDVVAHTTPARAILEYANNASADLITIATHGRGGWSRLALGSVADKVLRGADVPVLVYRPTGLAQEGGADAEREGSKVEATV